jgi:hypothetical protein
MTIKWISSMTFTGSKGNFNLNIQMVMSYFKHQVRMNFKNQLVLSLGRISRWQVLDLPSRCHLSLRAMAFASSSCDVLHLKLYV